MASQIDMRDILSPQQSDYAKQRQEDQKKMASAMEFARKQRLEAEEQARCLKERLREIRQKEKGYKWIDLREWFPMCEQFADTMAARENYSSRNQGNMKQDQIREQQLLSKLGETTVWQTMSSIFPDIKPPDFRIYDVIDKSYDSDLSFYAGQKFGIAVKSQWNDERRPSGWVFQWWGERGRSDRDAEIFVLANSTKNIIVTALVDNDRKQGRIYSFNWAMDAIVDKLFRHPISHRYVGVKVILYPELLPERGIEECQMWEDRKSRWSGVRTDNELCMLVEEAVKIGREL